MKNIALCLGLLMVGAGFVATGRIQPTKDDVEVLVDKLHTIVLPYFQEADGPKGISRIAIPRHHPIYSFGGEPSRKETVSLLLLASLSKDQEAILEGFSSKQLTVRISTLRPIKGVMTVGGVASTKGKTDPPISRSEFEAFQKAISTGCDQGWARLSAGKATITKGQGWTHYYRPIKSNLAECVNCHSRSDGRNMQLGDTVGVVCYSVKKD